MIPERHLAALKIICDRLSDMPTAWAVTGSFGMALQGMEVEVHDIDLQTSDTGAYEIGERLSEYVVQPVRLLPSERISSHFGVCEIAGVKVEIMGSVQKWIDGQGWEEPVDVALHRRFVKIGEMRVPVVSLKYEYEAYRKLGRAEKAAAIKRFLDESQGNGSLRPLE